MDANRASRGFGCAIASLAYPVLFVLLLVVHVWTVLVAYQASGIFPAVISFMLPILAELYWTLQLARETGDFVGTNYCMANVTLLVAWAIVFVGSRMAGVADPDATAQNAGRDGDRAEDGVVPGAGQDRQADAGGDYNRDA